MIPLFGLLPPEQSVQLCKKHATQECVFVSTLIIATVRNIPEYNEVHANEFQRQVLIPLSRCIRLVWAISIGLLTETKKTS